MTNDTKNDALSTLTREQAERIRQLQEQLVSALELNQAAYDKIVEACTAIDAEVPEALRRAV